MAPSSTLPFETFLELLRAKGYGIGLQEYAATANLLEHWDRLHAAELGDALSALIGRNEDEVAGIRRLFDTLYAPAPPPVPTPVPTHVDPLAPVRHHIWASALIAAVVMVIAAALALFPRPEPQPRVPIEVSPVRTSTGVTAVSVPPPPAPPLPPPPQHIQRRPLAEVLAGGFLAALALFWSIKAREDRRTWRTRVWSSLRGALPGPYHYSEVIRHRPARLPKADVEDAATLLGRVFSSTSRTRELDVPRSLRATLRRGLMPTIITRPRRRAETILVLQDISQDMQMWEAIVEGFLADLRRQGIALDRMYFDADPTRLSDRPFRPVTTIDRVLRARPDAPILIISSGAGLSASLESSTSTWIAQVAARARRTWLTPVTDVALWPQSLLSLPLDVWPMTHLGLAHAARQLSALDAGTPMTADVRARIGAEGHVGLADIERLKRLASLVPHPSPDLLDLLRLRFAPDIPMAAILHLMLQAEGPSAPLIALGDGEVQRALTAVRRETPDLEAAVREMVLAVLMDSEPAADSTAHARWEIAVETQRLLLADVRGSKEHVATASAALATLARGPMWEEVQQALTLVPASAPVRGMIAGVTSDRGPRTAPPVHISTSGDATIPWSWPGLRELVPAATAAALVLGAAVGLHALPVRPVEHVLDAYNLDYEATPTASTPRLSLSPRWRNDGLPRRVDLYQDDHLYRSGLALTDGAPTVVPLTSDDTGKYYQVRATLPTSNLAVSKAVWVTSDRLAYVLIDASPWANATISSPTTKTAPQQTPFTAALLPGTYQVHFDNPDLGVPSSTDRTLEVPVGGTTLYVPMPGFDAARAVDSLMPRPGQSKR
ncbi:MAG: VWA domain-containing protein [Vicinamibacterales bacterium]